MIENSDLRVIQLNIRGLFGKQDKLLKLINCCNKMKIDVVLLEETWLSKKIKKGSKYQDMILSVIQGPTKKKEA